MKVSFALLLSAISSTAVAVRAADTQARAAETCADPSLTTTYFDLFSPTRTAHIIRAQMDMINYNSNHGTTDDFQFVAPSFLAWRNAQNFTTAFYQLMTPSGSEFLYLLEDNGNAPTATGFTDQGIVGYAYATQICGSVPLFSASNAAASDRYWTTNQADHAALLALGWVDTGIPFYVLPLDCSCSS